MWNSLIFVKILNWPVIREVFIQVEVVFICEYRSNETKFTKALYNHNIINKLKSLYY